MTVRPHCIGPDCQKAAAMSVRIVDVREITRPISSPIRNAYIDFTKMTTSLVAVVTDAVRDGKKVVGYGCRASASKENPTSTRK